MRIFMKIGVHVEAHRNFFKCCCKPYVYWAMNLNIFKRLI